MADPRNHELINAINKRARLQRERADLVARPHADKQTVDQMTRQLSLLDIEIDNLGEKRITPDHEIPIARAATPLTRSDSPASDALIAAGAQRSNSPALFANDARANKNKKIAEQEALQKMIQDVNRKTTP